MALIVVGIGHEEEVGGGEGEAVGHEAVADGSGERAVQGEAVDVVAGLLALAAVALVGLVEAVSGIGKTTGCRPGSGSRRWGC
ncbi:hypothetical protein DAETH_31410 [Deinococcus aetherius]|uniref:Uncharacterized protein n=1 Tax=Deinococcus aetherius TaxID=200252 RepID=A0ABN6RII6_9DEIO|nr:hypothetical protein DAETH_31410 [Deinococcus aetherius]